MGLELSNEALKLINAFSDTGEVKSSICKRYMPHLNALRGIGRAVVCGNSPYAPHVARVLRNKYGCDVAIVDSLNEVPFSETGDCVYIITSTKFLGDYSELFMNRETENIIPYQALPILDKDFDFPRRAYSAAFFHDCIDSIVQNSAAFKDLLVSMADVESTEIMAKLICYRLTADYRYAPVSNHRDVYFGYDFLNVTPDEVFVDGGGFDGDTIEAYLRHYHNFNTYCFFEPETKLLEIARERFPYPNIQFSNLALYNETKTLSFKADGNGMGEISGEGNIMVQTGRLDEVVDKPVSFIKLDVEGVELAALKGASEMVRNNKPKLAISVYHNAHDLLTLAEYVKKLVPEYKLFLRCGFNSVFNDLVLFAVT